MKREGEVKNAPAFLVAPIALAASLGVWAVLALVGVPALAAVVPAAAAGLAAAARFWLRAPQSALRTLRARPLRPGDHPRLENLVEGLCTTHGFRRPCVHVVETAAVNAASVGMRRTSAHLVVTRGALSGLDRLELEAVVARQLCETRRGVARPTVLSAVLRVPGLGRLTAFLSPLPGGDAAVEIDVEAARLISFPPALASALKKAADGPGAEAPAAAAHLWMVAPQRTSPGPGARFSTVQRIDVLGEI